MAPSIERRLAAIMAADVVGFSRLMGADEAGTLGQLKSHRQELIDPEIAQRNGRIVKTMGDGLLVEFGSVVDAVQCAVAVQTGMVDRNAGVADDRRIEFRIGINVGDVIVEDDDIYGDGVNVAARLESLAEPGGICVSRSARDQIRDKLSLVLEDLDEREVKNIAWPIRVFRVRLERAKPEASRGASAQNEGLQLPDKPSIAVLPLTNLSDDPEQEVFADGITEDIITELSRFKDLFVIARNSTFTCKGQAVKVQDVGKDLGVHYVVEGSVRRSGQRVRVTVQLIDASTGSHIWAERYDRDLDDIFELQDEVTRAIVAILPGRLEAAGLDRTQRKPTENMAAYDYVIRGKILHHRGTAEDNAEALRMLEKAIELDPGYAQAHAWQACTLGQAWVRGFIDDREYVWKRVVDSLQTSLSLDENESECHRILAAVHLVQNEHDKAWHHQERALALNPNNDLIVDQNGELLTWLGKPGRVEDWRASVRVRWLFRRFRFGPQSGSLDYVSSPRSSNRTCGFPASGFRTRSCLRSRRALGRVRQASEAVFVVQPFIREPHEFSGTRLVLQPEPPAQPPVHV